MVALRDRRDLGAALDQLAGALESLDPGPALPALTTECDRLTRTIRHYLIPRVDDPSTPLTVVFAGPTGSGKSTLINSVTGSDVSRADVVRPTTRVPVVVASHDNQPYCDTLGGIDCDVVVRDASIVERMALVDTPDVDSTSTAHRVLAEALIDNADIVVFVTSALRYADDVPWQVLRRAVARGTNVIHVLNRVSSATAGASVDFRSRLRKAGMDDDVVTVPEHHVGAGAQSIPSIAVKSLRNRLMDLASSRERQDDDTVDSVLTAVVGQVSALAASVTHETDERESLEADLSLRLSARVSQLSLAGSGAGLFDDPPTTDRERQVQKWKKSNRGGNETQDWDIDTVVARVETLVERDLRAWLAAERSDIATDEIAPELSVDALRPVIHSAIRGWAEFVRRMTEDRDPRERRLDTAVLLDAALGDERSTRATDVMYGDQAPVLVERARRELASRLEVIYEQAALQVADSIRPGQDVLSDSQLRAALGAVTSALAPVHA